MAARSIGRILLAALIIWIAGVVIIRLAGDLVLVEGTGLVVGFVAAALGGPPTVWLGALLTGFSRRRMVAPVLLIAATALILDGAVMAFAPTVYTDPDRIRFLAPLFLWTFGWACLSAWVMAEPSARQPFAAAMTARD